MKRSALTTFSITVDISVRGKESATRVKFLCFNANSIGKNPKRSKIFHHLKKKNPHFVLACDTRIAKSIEPVVRDEWGGRCVFNSFSSQARGVAIFFKKGNSADIVDKFCDQEGNLLALLLVYEDKKILLEVLYGPNDDSPIFYEECVFKKIQEWQPDFSIFCGDFNIALNPEIDTKNYCNISNPNARLKLLEQIDDHNLVDIWRDLHPDDRKYTWRKFNQNKQGRLDFFLVSSSLLPYVESGECRYFTQLLQ